jgi:trehalose-6-phosphate synthase
VLINTSLREGVSIPPLEFAMIKRQQEKLAKSAMILSEFAGCAKHLVGALHVNPYDSEAIGNAIFQVVEMPAGEKEDRMQESVEYSARHSTLRWAQKFLTDLKRSDDHAHYTYEKIGHGRDWRIVKFKQGFRELKPEIMENIYTQSRKRLIVIDQEGVIPMR